MKRKRSTGGLLGAACLVILLVAASGCGTVYHTLKFEDDYKPKAETAIEVGSVSNETGKTFDIAIESMLKEALIQAFSDESLLRTDNRNLSLTTNCRIIEYEKGNAFKRWLVPGWGSTVLTIECDLLDSNSKVGTLIAKRTVDGGGGYSVGAWEKVFQQLAGDVVQDVKEKIGDSKEK